MVLTPSTEGYFFVIQGYVALYAMLIVIGTYGVYLIIRSRSESLESNKLYQRGLGAFFASVAASQALYLTDVVYRTFYSGVRLIPILEGADSFHQQFYFIIILTAVSLAMAFLVYPVEKFMLRRERKIFTVLVSISIPVPLILRALELVFLPRDGDLLYYVFSAGYLYCWIVIALSIIQVLFLYLKVAREISGVLRKRALFVVTGMIVWLVTIFVGSDILRNSATSPEQFWIMPVLEAVLLVLLLTGFKTEEERAALVERPSLFTPAIKKIIVVVFIAAVFLTACFYVYDLDISTWTQSLPGAHDDGSFWWFADEWGEYPTWIVVGIGVLIYLASFRKKSLVKFRPYLWFLFLTAIIAPGIISGILKYTINRPRPGDSNGFYPLFTIGPEVGDKSFPSGHTASAFVLFALVYLIPKEKRTLKVLAGIGLAAWGISIAVARVVWGSHYPGDTLFGALISLLTELVLWIWRYRAKIVKGPVAQRQPAIATA